MLTTKTIMLPIQRKKYLNPVSMYRYKVFLSRSGAEFNVPDTQHSSVMLMLSLNSF